jgi:triosephosphate isomerase (TIM)
MDMRKKIVAGNWKMNNTLEEGLKLASEIVNMVQDEVMDKDVKIVMAPPALYVSSIAKLVQDKHNIFVAAQNCNEHASGAYTGEISAAMLKSVNAKFVILGHSERRQYFEETNEQLAKKVDASLSNDIIPIFCCGEPLEIREKGTQNEYVCQQLTESLFHLNDEQFSKVVIAYEPIWAIGTGKTASSEQAQDMHKALRDHLAGKYGKQIADNTPILYGGSCNPKNAKELFACPDVDGGLIGGASLKSRDFVDIIKSF